MEKEWEGDGAFQSGKNGLMNGEGDGTDIICHFSSSSFQTRSAREMKGALAGEMGEEIEIPDGVDSAHLIRGASSLNFFSSFK